MNCFEGVHKDLLRWFLIYFLPPRDGARFALTCKRHRYLVSDEEFIFLCCAFRIWKVAVLRKRAKETFERGRQRNIDKISNFPEDFQCRTCACQLVEGTSHFEWRCRIAPCNICQMPNHRGFACEFEILMCNVCKRHMPRMLMWHDWEICATCKAPSKYITLRKQQLGCSFCNPTVCNKECHKCGHFHLCNIDCITAPPQYCHKCGNYHYGKNKCNLSSLCRCKSS